MTIRISRFVIPVLICLCMTARAEDKPVILRGENGVAVAFERTATGYLWTGYADEEAGTRWRIGGPRFSVQTPDDKRTNLGDTGFESLVEGDARVVLETALVSPPILVRQTFCFCADGRTVRIQSAVRATDAPVKGDAPAHRPEYGVVPRLRQSHLCRGGTPFRDLPG